MPVKRQPQRTHVGFGPPPTQPGSFRGAGAARPAAESAHRKPLPALQLLPGAGVAAGDRSRAGAAQAGGAAGSAQPAIMARGTSEPGASAAVAAQSSARPAEQASSAKVAVSSLAAASVSAAPGQQRWAAAVGSNEERPSRAQAAADRAHNDAVLAAAAQTDAELASMLQRDELGGGAGAPQRGRCVAHACMHACPVP